MARANSILLASLRGAIGKEIVIKQYGKKTVITKYPDMSKVKPTRHQKKGRKLFGEAVAFARSVLNNPKLKEQYESKKKKRQTVYHFAIQEYLREKNKK